MLLVSYYVRLTSKYIHEDLSGCFPFVYFVMRCM